MFVAFSFYGKVFYLFKMKGFVAIVLVVACLASVCGQDFGLNLDFLNQITKNLKLQLHGNYCGLNHGDATYTKGKRCS